MIYSPYLLLPPSSLMKIISIPVFTDEELSLRDSDLPKATQGVHFCAWIWNWVSQVDFQSLALWIMLTGPGAQNGFRLLVLKTCEKAAVYISTHMCSPPIPGNPLCLVSELLIRKHTIFIGPVTFSSYWFAHPKWIDMHSVYIVWGIKSTQGYFLFSFVFFSPFF